MIDWFRRTKREVPRDLEANEEGAPVAAAESAPQSAMDLLRWAKKELPEGEENEKTLEWMLREGAGEKLETIAAEANVPAPRVRQRVSRLRRYYKARWAAQAAALAALLLIALAIALALRQRTDPVAPAPGPSFLPQTMPTPEPSAPEAPPPEEPAWSTQPPQALPQNDSKSDTNEGIPLKPTPVPTSSAMPPPKKAKPRSKPIGPSKMGSSDFTVPVPPPPAPTSSLNDWGTKP